jgi:hypothetical protein
VFDMGRIHGQQEMRAEVESLKAKLAAASAGEGE